jgi:two-component system NtrC family sensor kinase
MAVLHRFSVDDLVSFSADLRSMAPDAETMEEVCEEVTRYLLDNLCDDDGEPACVLVSMHKTHRFERLPERLQADALEADDTVASGTACLVLLARAESAPVPPPEPGDRVRPLTARAFRERPIFVRLLESLGADTESLLDPTRALAMQMQHRELNVYVEPDLVSSDLVDEEAGEQARALGVRGVVALGGILPSGDLFLLSLITTVDVDDHVADLLRSLGTAVKVPLIPSTFRPFAT